MLPRPPREPRDQRVLIVGGTGATGRLIARELAMRLPDHQIDVASRRAEHDAHVPAGVGRVALDASDANAVVRTLENYRLAVLALGPFDIHGGAIHRLCIEARCDALDVNDSFDAASRIFALAPLAIERDVMIATGFGLTPGLSTLLLMMLLEAAPNDRALELAVRLFMGAKNGGGESSPFALLAGLRSEVAEIVRGALARVRAERWGDASYYSFPRRGKTKMIHYSSPESLTLARRALPIARLSHKYHMQFLPRALGSIFEALPFLQKSAPLSVLSRLIARLNPLMRSLPTSNGETILVAECAGRRAVVRGDRASYAWTATFAAMHAEMICRRELPRRAGVLSFEDCYRPELDFGARLKARGIDVQLEEAA